MSPEFLTSGGLDGATSITVFNPLIETPGVQDFIQAYRAKYGIMPTQRSFFAYEATNLVVDAIRRANSDKAQDMSARSRPRRCRRYWGNLCDGRP